MKLCVALPFDVASRPDRSDGNNSTDLFYDQFVPFGLLENCASHEDT